MHANSKLAYAEELERLNRREKEVLGALHTGAQLTDRQIMHALGYTDPNKVRPRITKLIEKYWVIQVNDMIDDETGKRVRIVKALAPWERKKLIAQLEEDKRQMDLFEKKAA